MAVSGIARKFAEPLSKMSMPQLWSAFAAWRAMQRAALPRQALLSEETSIPLSYGRYMRFAASTFGSVWFAGLIEGMSWSVASRAREVTVKGGGEGAAAVAAAGLDPDMVEVLAFEQQVRDTFAPGYLVAVDHEIDA